MCFAATGGQSFVGADWKLYHRSFNWRLDKTSIAAGALKIGTARGTEEGKDGGQRNHKEGTETLETGAHNETRGTHRKTRMKQTNLDKIRRLQNKARTKAHRFGQNTTGQSEWKAVSPSISFLRSLASTLPVLGSVPSGLLNNRMWGSGCTQDSNKTMIKHRRRSVKRALVHRIYRAWVRECVDERTKVQRRTQAVRCRVIEASSSSNVTKESRPCYWRHENSPCNVQRSKHQPRNNAAQLQLRASVYAVFLRNAC